MSAEESVKATRDGRIGRLLLNRPKALNALDLPMIRALTRALLGWRDDPHVHAVVIEGAGERAFCAGGDIRAVRQHATGGRYRDGRGVLRRGIRAEPADRRISRSPMSR